MSRETGQRTSSVVFDQAFFRELSQRLRQLYRFLADNAIFGVILFVVVLVLVLIQQVILILLYPFR